MSTLNLTLPGNPRYQPKSLQPIFGYDHLFSAVAEVEIATMMALADIGVISAEDIALLTDEVIEQLKNIPTTRVDEVERSITKHDIRAWVQIAQQILPEPLRRWLHVPLTSYDALDTARTLQYMRAHQTVLKPEIAEVISTLEVLVRRFAGTIQVGRTHGQHALPITVGFWLATILNRILANAEKMDQFAGELVGKISGAVGAHNATVGLGIEQRCRNRSFEQRVLKKLGLKSARISSQILPPEPLAYYLNACVFMSAAIAQLGRDCRHLMRSEIAEVSEPFSKHQVGSSTMAHKRNPMTFEGLEGHAKRTVSEYIGVLMTLVSEHQRDLVGSCVYRDFPTIVVNLVVQLETLLRRDKETDMPFLGRIAINEEACAHNFQQSAHVILAEPLYIALAMAGYTGDAHELVSRRVVPRAIQNNILLIRALDEIAETDPQLQRVCSAIPHDVRELLTVPQRYSGDAEAKALVIADAAVAYLAQQ